MAPSMSTFVTLRALHLVIADALDDIQRVFSQNTLPDPPSSTASQCSSPVYPSSPDPSALSSFPATPPASFPPTPLSATFPSSPPHTDARVPFVDYPSPDQPFLPSSTAEQLALHPDAAVAASRIVAACGQMSNIVHKPVLSLCDAIMSYTLPACMRLVEHLHVAEILREAEENRQHCRTGGQEAGTSLSDAKSPLNLGASGPIPVTGMERIPTSSGVGLHVADITKVICSYVGYNYIDPNNLVHALRLLSTHHIFRETEPDTFALNRVASLLDSGKSVKAVFASPETKYDESGGAPALVALTTDELFKSAAYLTEAFTGVQLPKPGSIPDPYFLGNTLLSGTTTLPSTPDYATNDPSPCAPMTRSSSVLTHIMYPGDEDAQAPSRLRRSTESLESVKYNTPLVGFQVCSRPLATAPSPPLLRVSQADESVPMDMRQRSGDTVKQHRLTAFNLAFRTTSPFFDWLESGGKDPLGGGGQGAGIRTSTTVESIVRDGMLPNDTPNCVLRKSFRLDRFSKAMMGTTGWEAPKAILGGFDWYSLPRGSTIVDVGGGIGSTTMILARTLSEPKVDLVRKQDGAHEGLQHGSAEIPRLTPRLPSDLSLTTSDEPRNNLAAKNDVNLRFVVQDRPEVTALGIDAWRSKCPELLESGQVIFQDQDFFEPQSPLGPPHLARYPAVYLLRVVLHDWPDELARRILINLRVASKPDTQLVIAEQVLPLACVDEDVEHGRPEAREGSGTQEWTLNTILANIEGAERTLVPAPLLSNLGKASANAYWMDLLMQISLNGKERTLREFCALALSAGWRVMRMTRPEGLLFAYLICEPITLPDDAQAIYNAVVLSSELATVVAVPSDEPVHQSHAEPSRHKPLPARPLSLLPSSILERSSSRCGTPTFGSRMLLPKDEDLPSPRNRGGGVAKKWLKSKGLGVRSVMMQKAEKQREEQNLNLAGNLSTQDIGDAHPSPSSHVRVWWKKSHSNSTSNSSIAVQELNSEAPEHRATGQGRRGTLKSNDSPSTPSPRTSPVHQTWPSIESAAVSTPEASPRVPQVRRPSIASIKRKLSFATFGRRPSFADVTEPLPTPPPSATLTELAAPAPLQGDTRRSLKHLPSLPTLRRSEVSSSTTTKLPAMPRRSSLSFASRTPPPPPALKSALPFRGDNIDSPKSSIIKPANKQTSPEICRLGESTSIPRRQRRVTLSNSPSASSQAQGNGSVKGSVPANPTIREVKRMPSVPKLPRHLSIPRLRRKQSQPVIQDTESKRKAG